jgi:hypothetical protein
MGFRCVAFAAAFVWAWLNCTAGFASNQFGLVSTERLNLRTAAQAGSEVVAELPSGTAVIITGSEAEGWLPVRTFIGGQMKDGWVSARFIQMLEVPAPEANSPAPSAPPLPPAPAFTPRYISPPSPLQVSVADFDCREYYLGDGYRDCEAQIEVSYDGHPDVEGTFQVNCTVEARLEHRGDLLSSSRSFDGSESLWVSRGQGRTTVTVGVQPSFSLEPLIKAELEDAECEYSR